MGSIMAEKYIKYMLRKRAQQEWSLYKVQHVEKDSPSTQQLERMKKFKKQALKKQRTNPDNETLKITYQKNKHNKKS